MAVTYIVTAVCKYKKTGVAYNQDFTFTKSYTAADNKAVKDAVEAELQAMATADSADIRINGYKFEPPAA